MEPSCETPPLVQTESRFKHQFQYVDNLFALQAHYFPDKAWNVNAVMALDSVMTKKELRRRFLRLCEYNRFRCVTVKRVGFFGQDIFEAKDMENAFDPYDVIHESEVECTRCEYDFRLSQEVTRIVTQRMNPDLPPWELTLTQWNVEGKCHSTILIRVNHSVGDGYTATLLLQEIIDTQDEDHLLEARADLNLSSREASAKNSKTRSHPPVEVHPFVQLWTSFFECVALLLIGLGRLPYALYLLYVVPLLRDSRCAFAPYGRQTGKQKVAFTKTFSVEEVKTCARNYGGTLNDLAIAAITGATRKYLEMTNATDEDKIRLSMYVLKGLRDPRGKTLMYKNSFGNDIAFFVLPLEIHKESAEQRFDRIVRMTKKCKHFPTMQMIVLQSRLARLMGIPWFLRYHVMEQICSNTFGPLRKAFGLTNVMGPPSSVSICGKRVTDIKVLINFGGVLTLYTYNGRMNFGIVFEDELIDVHVFKNLLELEIESLI